MALLLLTLALFLAAPATGAGLLVLDAIPVGLPDNVGMLLTEHARAAVEEQRPGLLLPRSAFENVLSEAGRRVDPALLKKLERARDAYFAGDSKGAVAILEPLKAELDADALGSADLDPLVDCYRLLAAAYSETRQTEKIAPLIETLVRLRPDEPPDTNLYPQALAKAFSDRLAAVTSRGAISARSEPEGALVYLDGRLLGPAPQKKTGLVPGVHFLRFELLGRSADGDAVEVPAGGEVEHTGKLAPTAAAGEWARLKISLAAPGPAEESRTLAAALARAAGASQALLLVAVGVRGGVYLGAARLDGEAVAGRAWTLLPPDLSGAGEAVRSLTRAVFAAPLSDGGTLAPVRVTGAALEIDPPPDFEAALLGLGGRPAREADGQSFPALATAPAPAEESLWGNWWLWGGAAVFLAGGATALYLFTRSSEGEAVPPHVTVTVVLP